MPNEFVPHDRGMTQPLSQDFRDWIRVFSAVGAAMSSIPRDEQVLSFNTWSSVPTDVRDCAARDRFLNRRPCLPYLCRGLVERDAFQPPSIERRLDVVDRCANSLSLSRRSELLELSCPLPGCSERAV